MSRLESTATAQDVACIFDQCVLENAPLSQHPTLFWVSQCATAKLHKHQNKLLSIDPRNGV